MPGYKSFELIEDNKNVKINTIYKNRQGYIYAGTVNGLYKFDGENFRKISFNNPDYNDTVTAIYQDNQHKTWVGFQNGRLAHIIGGKLVYYNPEEGTASKRITAILQDKHGQIWYAAYGEGIYYIKNDRHYLFDADDGLSDVNISSLVLTQSGEVLAGTDQGLNICTLTGDKKNVIVKGPAEGLPDYIVTHISPAGNDVFWVALQDKGICMYDHKTKRLMAPAASADWHYGQVNATLADGDVLWIATENSGLLQYNIRTQVLQNHPVAVNHITQVMKDNQGYNWFLTPEKGLMRMAGSNLQILPLYPSAFFEIIHAILYDSSGNIWVNDDMALIRFTPSSTGYSKKRIVIPGLKFTSDITALYEDRFRNIWIATMGQGLFVLNPSTGYIRQLNENLLFKNASILSLTGKGDTIFVCSLQGAALVSLQPENKDVLHPYKFTYLENVNSNADFIYSIFKDSRNRTWFATDGMGLILRETNGSFQYFNNEKQIKSDHIYSITEHKSGDIWFSTASAGIYRYDGKNFTNYALKEGLTDLYISVIKSLPSGHIVIVHRKGLDVLDPVSGHIFYLNNNTGIGTVNADNLGAVTTDHEGNILVTSSKGILSFSIPAGTDQKPVSLIESVQLNLEEIDTSATRHFAHDENNFTFNYSGLYYPDPSQVFFQYKLEGLDSNWIITKDRSHSFPRLGAGRYTFRIRSSLNKNFSNAHEASYSFEIRKPFYETFWFIGGLILVIFGSMYWYIKEREKRIKKIQRLQEEKMQYKFEVLRNQVNPHFLFNSFNTLISSIEEDPKMAVEYAEQLSDFFRNIVNYRDKEIIPLQEEIGLLRTYFFLQQKRYGSNLQLQIDIDPQKENAFNIPPLTLQLLLENAIKHNVVSRDNRLLVKLSLDDTGILAVENEKHKREIMQPGAGMGLQNISNRFHILTGRRVQVVNEQDRFIVKLPLIRTPHD